MPKAKSAPVVVQPAHPVAVALPVPPRAPLPRTSRAKHRAPSKSASSSPLGPCAGCDVDCCSTTAVPLSLDDVARLSSTLNLPPRDFVSPVAAQPADPVASFAWGEARRALALRRRGDGSCAFLVRFGAFRRCGVHALRPAACRVFPFVHDAAAQRASKGNTLLQLHPSHCPWRWPSSDARKAEVLADLDALERARESDAGVLARWSGAVDEDAFWAFLDEALARRATS